MTYNTYDVSDVKEQKEISYNLEQDLPSIKTNIRNTGKTLQLIYGP